MSDGGLIAAVVIETLALVGLIGYIVYDKLIRPNLKTDESEDVARGMLGMPPAQARYVPAAQQQQAPFASAGV